MNPSVEAQIVQLQEDDAPKEGQWDSLPVNSAELENGHERPVQDVYEPSPIWQRPPGQAVRGIDAFKLSCRINSLKEPAAVVIGDSGAAPTLISQSFLDSLKASKPRPRKGHKLNLIQLTGQASCSEYVRLNLYFQSQLGPVSLKGVEAYVVKGMQAKLLIGEDTQRAWQLHSMRPAGKAYWKVGELPHLIPVVPGQAPAESFTTRWVTPEPEPPELKPSPSTSRQPQGQMECHR